MCKSKKYYFLTTVNLKNICNLQIVRNNKKI